MNFQKMLLHFALGAVLLPMSASALLMRENGPEPIIVQIKESLRQSDDLDTQLNELASLRRQNRLSIEKWWAGNKLMVMLSFPRDFTEQQAVSVVSRLQRSPAVEKVVAVSAQNLEFKSRDFAREYGANETIPDVARRGFDRGRIGRPAYRPPDQLALFKTPHMPDRLIVRWKDELVWNSGRTGFSQRVATFNQDAHCRVVREERHSSTDFVQILESEDISLLADKLKKYMDSGLVEYAQPDYLYEALAAPNDPAYSSAPGAQWDMRIISAEQAWDLSTGADFDSVIIAIADTGANVNHPDFITNLWSGQNNGENKNFYDHTPDVNASGSDHGSNVAAVIGAQGNNGSYMTGVAWDVSLMHLKVFGSGSNPGAPSSAIKEAIEYALARGVSAINLSLGRIPPRECEVDVNGRIISCDPPPYDPDLYKALQEARDGNMVVVTSAGNNGLTNNPDGNPQGNNDDDTNLVSPASIPTNNNIAVLATTPTDALAPYSSYGTYRVDLGAPGGSYPNPPDSEKVIGLRETFTGDSFDFSSSGSYSFFIGTSQAAPHVTGALALVKNRFPWENYSGIRDRVLMGTDRTGTLEGRCRTNGRLNLYKALQTRSMFRNLSTRARVEDGDRVMVAGFVIGGSPNGSALKVALRGRGPSLQGYGLNAALLGNPRIELYDSAGNMLDANNNWYEDPNAADTVASGMQPPDDSEAVLVRWLNPGTYTVVLRDEGSQYGVGLFEIYELQNNTNEQSRLLNLSTRCLVGTGDEEAIAGIIVGDLNNTGLPKPDRRVLMFGKGPSIPGVSGTLSDPQLDVLSTGEANDNWGQLPEPLQEKLVEASLAPVQGAESALWPTFVPGAYTVRLQGANGSSGVGLIEFYEY